MTKKQRRAMASGTKFQQSLATLSAASDKAPAQPSAKQGGDPLRGVPASRNASGFGLERERELNAELMKEWGLL